MGSKKLQEAKKKKKEVWDKRVHSVLIHSYEFYKRQVLFIATERRSVLAWDWGGAVGVQKGVRELFEVMEMFYINNMDQSCKQQKEAIHKRIHIA